MDIRTAHEDDILNHVLIPNTITVIYEWDPIISVMFFSDPSGISDYYKIVTKVTIFDYNQVTDPPVVTPDPSIQWGTTMYTFVDAYNWINYGELQVLTGRFGNLSVEPYRERDTSQAWLMSSTGEVRSLFGKGAYITVRDGCMAPLVEEQPSENSQWQLMRVGSNRYQNKLVSTTCNKVLTSGISDIVRLDNLNTDDGQGWFVLPVGTVG